MSRTVIDPDDEASNTAATARRLRSLQESRRLAAEGAVDLGILMEQAEIPAAAGGHHAPA
ncbi:hypothetical protein [Streptomyces sp. SYSU K217416]